MSAFIMSTQVDEEAFEWGAVKWRCRHANTGSSQIVVMEVTLEPGQAHAFHRHPLQEEFITIQSGTVIQYIEQESAQLEVGDSVHVGADTVHATFNVGDDPAKVFVVISPAIGANSYEVIDVADQEPWASISVPTKRSL